MKTTIIAEHRCKDRTDLAAISSVGPAELERYFGRGAGHRHAG
jgi:hypothetical protein